MGKNRSANDFRSEADLAAYAQAHPDEQLACSCRSKGCDYCAGEGTYPAWIHDPEITGYPHERKR